MSTYLVGNLPIFVGMAVSLRDEFLVPGNGAILGVVNRIDASDPLLIHADVDSGSGLGLTPYFVTNCRDRIVRGSGLRVMDGFFYKGFPSDAFAI